MVLMTGLLTACEISTRMLGNPAYLAPLDYIDWLQAAEPASLDQERMRLEALTGEPGNPVSRIQLALLLSLSDGADAGDRKQALDLLDDALASSAEATGKGIWTQPRYLTLGRLWQTTLQDDIARHDDDQEKDKLRRQVRELQDQIEALTSIEQQLIEREQSQIQGKSP